MLKLLVIIVFGLLWNGHTGGAALLLIAAFGIPSVAAYLFAYKIFARKIASRVTLEAFTSKLSRKATLCLAVSFVLGFVASNIAMFLNGRNFPLFEDAVCFICGLLLELAAVKLFRLNYTNKEILLFSFLFTVIYIAAFVVMGLLAIPLFLFMVSHHSAY